MPPGTTVSLRSNGVQEGAFTVQRRWTIEDGDVVVDVTMTATTDTGVGSQHLEVLPVALSDDLSPDLQPTDTEDGLLTFGISLSAGDETVIRLTGSTSLATEPEVEAALTTAGPTTRHPQLASTAGSR